MMDIIRHFPNARACRFTSPEDPSYNCIAWATEETDRWWWPDPMGLSYWPPGVVRIESIPAFIAAFATLGYGSVMPDALKASNRKIAIYAKENMPTHAARQTPDGRWTSKLGRSEDVSLNLDDLCGDLYGSVAVILCKSDA